MKVYVLWYYSYGAMTIYAITKTIKKAEELQRRSIYDLQIIEQEVLK